MKMKPEQPQRYYQVGCKGLLLQQSENILIKVFGKNCLVCMGSFIHVRYMCSVIEQCQ